MLQRLFALVLLGSAYGLVAPPRASAHRGDTFRAPTRYGDRGTVELGASLGVGRLVDRAQLDVGPAIGFFVADGTELSAILWLHHVEAGRQVRSYATLLGEPSFHLRFNDSVLGFLGVGLGVNHVDGVGAGFAVAPRLGLKVVLGRAGVLVPAIQVLYSAARIVETNEGRHLAMYGAPSASFGYMFAW